MARTKQTARKDTGGKPLAMGRGKKAPKKNPTPGKSADRKVVLEYSSDEMKMPQPAEGAEAPKRVKRQIHLTLPTSPAHVTTTESFTAFFINHGLTRASTESLCQKRLEHRPDEGVCHQLPEEARTAGPNAQNLWGRRHLWRGTVLSWQTGPKQPRRPRVVQEAPAGANHERSQQPAAVLVLAVAGAVHARAAAPVQVVQAVPEAKSEVVTTTEDDDPNKRRKTGGGGEPAERSRWLGRNHARRAQFTPQLTGSCHPSTSLAPRRELNAGPPHTRLD